MAKNTSNAAKANKPFVFDQILAAGFKAGQTQINQEKAILWYRNAIKRNESIAASQIINEATKAKRARVDVQPGRMYFYYYDPKTKDDLPFYDKFPMIFAIDFAKDGFTGINLHYCPYPFRAKLLQALANTADNKLYSPSTKLRISYQILKSASRMRAFKPCFKRYLYGHVRSKFVEVYPAEWATALWLPVAQWEKATEKTVHRHSTQKINA